MGICEIPSSSGNLVKVYDKERCICDLIKDRKKYEIQLYQTVIKEYMSSKEKNLSRLIEYAVKLGVRDEMIEIAVGKHFRENHEDKHKRDAKNGWYRYDSRFALPVYDDKGELERYNVFHTSMLIRHSNDGKLYLYDVIDIKKKRATLSANKRLPDKKPISFREV